MKTTDNNEPLAVDLSNYDSSLSLGNKVGRTFWKLVWLFLFRPSPIICFGWRRLLLQAFGAKIGKGVHVYPSCKIWAPWNLEIGDHSCLSHYVDCYCVSNIKIGAHATISQYSFLCTATHDISDPNLRLITKPIVIEDGAWVCADVFVGPGVTMGKGAVAGARAVVTRNVEPWQVVAGNPAIFVKERTLTASGAQSLLK
jgi:putative colanic acid biosynthesis acetyltransferase WcaF